MAGYCWLHRLLSNVFRDIRDNFISSRYMERITLVMNLPFHSDRDAYYNNAHIMIGKVAIIIRTTRERFGNTSLQYF